MKRLLRLIPDAEAIRTNRWIRWLGPALHHPRLWHLSRRGLAMGVALGLFFGLLIPIAQIPASTAAAVVLRANVPAAAAATLVTNPLTFGPIYYGAWRLGSALLGKTVKEGDLPPVMHTAPPVVDEALAALDEVAATIDGIVPSGPDDPHGSVDGAESSREGWWSLAVRRVLGAGKPLLLGLAVLSCTAGLLSYFLVSLFWAVRVRLKRRRRLQAGARPTQGSRPA